MIYEGHNTYVEVPFDGATVTCSDAHVDCETVFDERLRLTRREVQTMSPHLPDDWLSNDS